MPLLPDDGLPVFSQRGERFSPRRESFPDEGMRAHTAYQVVHDESILDGNARLNLATFVGTWMDEYASKLYAETFDKNMIDKDEYPRTAAAEESCWRMLAELWHAPADAEVIGTSTIGSSEAAMLGGLAFKRRWQHARRKAGKPTDRPNLVMSSAVQVCWEKFCNYWDVEARYVPVSVERPVLDGTDLADYVDENTIGVVAIVGVTYTGAYEPVERIAQALDEIEAETGLDVPIHVDGASGGMVAPFLSPELMWDFRLDRVHSINTSGHKYGLVYPGVGWVVWRSTEVMPDDLVFHVSYLGGDMPTLALNFSRPGAQVLLQLYLFLRLGREGYTAVQQTAQDVALHLSAGIAEIGAFELLSDGSDLPVFAYRIKEGHTDRWDLHHLSELLRAKGWLIPTYPMPESMSDVTVQRIVVRQGLSFALADDLLADMRETVARLDDLQVPLPSLADPVTFHH